MLQGGNVKLEERIRKIEILTWLLVICGVSISDVIRLTHQARGEQGRVNQLLIFVLSVTNCLKDLVWE